MAGSSMALKTYFHLLLKATVLSKLNASGPSNDIAKMIKYVYFVSNQQMVIVINNNDKSISFSLCKYAEK